MICQSCRLSARLLVRQSARPASAARSQSSSLLPRPQRATTSRQLSSSSARRQDEQPTSPTLKVPPTLPKDLISRLAGRQGGAYTRIRLASALYEACGEAGAYSVSEELRTKDALPQTEDGSEIGTAEGPWLKDLDLLPTFSTWAHVTMLHMYLVTAKIRCLDPAQISDLHQQFTNHFFLEAEHFMVVKHALSSGMMRQRYLKDLFVQWRGAVAAYDEGLLRGDAVLAAAVWRNLFQAAPEAAGDVRRLAAIVSWMRRNLQRLEKMGDVQFFEAANAGKLFVSSPREEMGVVDQMAPPLAGEVPGETTA